uniref:Uncharacterized protein n=1 Tax=Chromera velia CCMP2878 TaxID=1169474 RepID=A0A0G4FEY9_9ALVE|eukprot:Cvel_16651.t1-p1 / transcript=Cvel_16651.t1 / gene=Cvel_16651 / organism=Chromera_velia_CCMP2878 / gene_product=hypothetical protein / transcript_product=hypothetical protein / location=Cvel_scaffold1291:27956-28955(+) / protein_length=252 / sequence_SO=supercontig / SO=protein_coding / is_pseudo=false
MLPECYFKTVAPDRFRGVTASETASMILYVAKIIAGENPCQRGWGRDVFGLMDTIEFLQEALADTQSRLWEDMQGACVTRELFREERDELNERVAAFAQFLREHLLPPRSKWTNGTIPLLWKRNTNFFLCAKQGERGKGGSDGKGGGEEVLEERQGWERNAGQEDVEQAVVQLEEEERELERKLRTFRDKKKQSSTSSASSSSCSSSSAASKRGLRLKGRKGGGLIRPSSQSGSSSGPRSAAASSYVLRTYT